MGKIGKYHLTHFDPTDRSFSRFTVLLDLLVLQDLLVFLDL